MPKTKNFQRRITILDDCFSQRSNLYTLDSLQVRIKEKLDCDISRRTIQNDIDYIKNLIEERFNLLNEEESTVFEDKLFVGKKKAFRYRKPSYSLGTHLLNISDKEQLSETLAILSRYRSRSDFEWLDELFPRITNVFELVHEDYDSLISYQMNRDYKGHALVGKFYNQLLRKKVLLVDYQTFNGNNSYQRTIHPYHLKQYNDRWFLFGYEKTDNYSGITILALDRIISFTETMHDITPCEINWGDYFDDMIGVSKPNENSLPIKIKLRFSPNRIKYVLTKPLHGATQKRCKDDLDGLTIIITVIPNRELYQKILSFGKDVQVLEPTHVRDEMKKQVAEMMSFYTN